LTLNWKPMSGESLELMIDFASSSKTSSSAGGGSPSHSAWMVSQGFGGLETGRGTGADYSVKKA
jgi:hypothetical protein